MTNPETLDKLFARGQPGSDAARVELTGVLREGAPLYAVVRTGLSERILPILATDLAAFAAFQRRVQPELRILVAHASQLEATPRERRHAWQRAVERALARGS